MQAPACVLRARLSDMWPDLKPASQANAPWQAKKQRSLSHTKSGQPLITAATLGPRAGEFQCTCPWKAISQIVIALRVSWTWAPRVFKLDVLGACLSGSGLKSWGCLMWGLNPLHLREKLLFRFASWLWVSEPAVGCMVRLWCSLPYLLRCGPSLLVSTCLSYSGRFPVFLRGSRCMFVGEGEFRTLLHHHLRL